MQLTQKKRQRTDLLTVAAVAALFVVMAVLLYTGHLTRQVTNMLVPVAVYIVMAVSLNLVVGLLGELSLGHAGFMSVGLFSGCLVAIALHTTALPLGVRLPVNFDSPYRSLSLGEFWKRWHMTLTAFLRECVYFPLGGSRGGTARTCRNILLVYLISGLWHGAGWTFLVWGALHGLGQVIERLWGPGRDRLPRWARWALTFGFVNLAWVFFRAPDLDTAGTVLRQALLGGWGLPAWLAADLLPSEAQALRVLGLGGRAGTVLLAAVFAAGLAAALKPGNTLRRAETLRPTAGRCALCCLLLCWAALSFSGVTTFIYANF